GIDPEIFKVRDGDKFTVTYDFSTELQGDNMLGELHVDWSKQEDIPPGVTGTYMLFDGDGNELLDNDVDLGDTAILDSQDQQLPADNAGRSDDFSLTVSLDFTGLPDRFSADSPEQIA